MDPFDELAVESTAGHEAVGVEEPLGRNRDFRTLLSTQGVSSIGDAVSFTALPLLVFALTGSGAAMGVVGALQTLPDLLFGMVAGALADRTDRKRMMFLADAGRALLTAAIPLTVWLGGPTLAVILIVAAPMSVLRSLFLAGYTASVPAIVGRSQIARANALFEAVYSTGYIIGPAVAGLLSTLVGPGPTLAIDAVSFLLSAAGLFFVRRQLHAPERPADTHILTDIREGIDFIVGHPTLRAAIGFWGIASVTTAPLVPALTVYIKRDLALEDWALGLLLTVYGAGTVAGALIISRRRRGSAGPLLLGGNLMRGAVLVGVGVVGQLGLLLPLGFLAGVADSAVLITYLTLRTAHSPDVLLGRVGSTARTISLGLQPVGMLAGGLLIDATNGGTTIVVMGAAIAVLSLVFAPIRALRGAQLAPR
ncbi:MAG TPA: MFS transporter [Candidatus Limnocylindrales bacterium]|nr:MFS transporter [Candidatus Limnocylindrales bacterium]